MTARCFGGGVIDPRHQIAPMARNPQSQHGQTAASVPHARWDEIGADLGVHAPITHRNREYTVSKRGLP